MSSVSGKMSALGVADRFMKTKGAVMEKEFVENLKALIAKNMAKRRFSNGFKKGLHGNVQALLFGPQGTVQETPVR